MAVDPSLFDFLTGKATSPAAPPQSGWSYGAGNAPGGPPPGGALPPANPPVIKPVGPAWSATSGKVPWMAMRDAAQAAGTGTDAWSYGPARGAMPAGATSAAPPAGQGALYKGGKMLGKAVGRVGAPLALASMGFGMADKVAEIQADQNERGWGERALQIASGADVFGIGKGIANMAGFSGREPTPGAAPWYSGPGVTPTPTPVGPAEGMGLAQDQGQSAQVGNVNARIAAAVDEANTKSMWGAVNQYRAGQVPQMAPSYDKYYASQAGGGYGAREGAGPPGAIAYGRRLGENTVRSGSEGRYAGSMLRYGMARQEANRDLKRQLMAQDLYTKGPGMAKDTAEAASIRARQALAMTEQDPRKRADILAGRAVGHEPPALTYPENLQPLPGATGGGYAVAVSRDPNKPGAMRVPIREQIRGAQGTDNNYYKFDAAGKKIKMTDAEKAQFLAQKRSAGQ